MVLSLVPVVFGHDVMINSGENYEFRIPVTNIYNEEKIVTARILCNDCLNDSIIYEDEYIYFSTFNSTKFNVKEEKQAIFYVKSNYRQVDKNYFFEVDIVIDNKTIQNEVFNITILKKRPREEVRSENFSKFSIDNSYILFVLVLIMNYIGLLVFTKIDKRPISKVTFYVVLLVTSLILTAILRSIM